MSGLINIIIGRCKGVTIVIVINDR